MPLRRMNLARLQCRKTLLGTAAEDGENTLCICHRFVIILIKPMFIIILFQRTVKRKSLKKAKKKRGFLALFIKIVELYKIYQITFQERLTVVTNLQEMIGQKKNDFRSRLLGMSRRQIKSFLVQQFFKNAAEVQGE